MLLGGNVAGLLDGAGILLLALAIYFKWLPVWVIVLIAAVGGGLIV